MLDTHSKVTFETTYGTTACIVKMFVNYQLALETKCSRENVENVKGMMMMQHDK